MLQCCIQRCKLKIALSTLPRDCQVERGWADLGMDARVGQSSQKSRSTWSSMIRMQGYEI